MNPRLVSLILSILLIVGSLILGRVINVVTRNRKNSLRQQIEKIIFSFRNIAFYGMTPIIVFSAFWLVDFKNLSTISVPFIGLGALVFGTLSALAVSTFLHHKKKQRGAMFCAGSCSNIGTIGTLLCFAFFGEIGVVINALYKTFEAPYYFLFLYPTAKTYSDEEKTSGKNRLIEFLNNPVLIIFSISMALGIIFSLLGIPRPSLFSKLTNVFIPLSSFFLILAIGYTMRFSKLSGYKKEVFGISVIKYVLTPLFVIVASLALGLNHLGDGTLFKALIVLSALPSGFNSLIPAQMYGLDLDLANASWIFTTGLLIPVTGIIWFIIQ